MASWNERNEGDQQADCPVCIAKVSKKRLTTHLTKCFDANRQKAEEAGLFQCPLYPLHILPKKYLNHHLESCCEEAQNLLRKFFQKRSLINNVRQVPPPCFLADVPEEILNNNNKQLLYILKRDLYGNDVGSNAAYYPDFMAGQDGPD